LLVIQAEDDPIAPKHAIPIEELEANPNCILVVTPTGGHLGWCSGSEGILGAPWTDTALAEYFSAVQKLLKIENVKHLSEPDGVYTVSVTKESV